MSAARAAARRQQKAARRVRNAVKQRVGYADGFAGDVTNADRARKRQAMRKFGISGKRYRELEHRSKRIRQARRGAR